MKKYTLVAAAFLLAALGACSKKGEQIMATPVIKLTVTGFSTDPTAAFTVEVNGNLAEDSLYNGQTSTAIIPKVDGRQHIVIKDHFTGASLLDTAITMPGKTAVLTLLQLNADDAPVLVGETEENIPDNHRRQAFFYTTDILPDVIGFQIYACHYDPNTFTLMKTDTLATLENIKKGEISEFILIPDNPEPSTIYYFFQPLDATTLQPMPNIAMPFDPANYMGYLFSFDRGITGTEKHYINNIGAMGTRDFFDVTSDRLISY